MIPRKPRPNSAPKRVRPAVLGHLPVPKDAQSRTQLGVRITEATHQQFKLAAVMRGRGVTVQALVEQAMRETGIVIATRKGRTSKVRDTGAFNAGRSAANSVAINQGIAARAEKGGRLH